MYQLEADYFVELAAAVAAAYAASEHWYILVPSVAYSRLTSYPTPTQEHPFAGNTHATVALHPNILADMTCLMRFAVLPLLFDDKHRVRKKHVQYQSCLASLFPQPYYEFLAFLASIGTLGPLMHGQKRKVGFAFG